MVVYHYTIIITSPSLSLYVCMFMFFQSCVFIVLLLLLFLRQPNNLGEHVFSFLRALRGCPLGGPSNTRTTPSTFELIVGFLIFSDKSDVFYLISMVISLLRQLEKTTTWFQCTFSQKVGILNPWFLWPSKKNLPITEHPQNHVLYQQIYDDSLPASSLLHGFGLVTSTHDCSFQGPWCTQQKADMAHHW